ncbi:SixA phosphatase family protein [Hydrogenothermus marinus]|uniref:Phosphohistidine phosphatase SixA n=1 Tax=Hydrogenothermus marinus TaxID=133270 RepID=A0A3M0BIM1_9AQUI|nr:histidine phosphatase family protein [Hydrogenothermus marinus]RMA97230.1 phosphohistidine phosphatase SixA [Hydrogenothermus marinus]
MGKKDIRKIFLVRHAKAEKRENWEGDDCKRPLTEEGEKEFRKFTNFIVQILPEDIKIISSPCERALKTAKILAEVLYKEVNIEENLSPDAEPEDYLEVVKNYEGNIVLVGHEPDLSLFLNEITCISPNRVAFKKGTVAEIIEKKDKFLLAGFYRPNFLKS